MRESRNGSGPNMPIFAITLILSAAISSAISEPLPKLRQTSKAANLTTRIRRRGDSEAYIPNYCNNTDLISQFGLLRSPLGQFLGWPCSDEFFHCRWQSDGYRTYRKHCKRGLVYDTLGTQNCNYDYNVKDCGFDGKGLAKCKDTDFTCQLSERCIPMGQRCDGKYDCVLEEDEQNCPMCKPSEFACVISEQCIPIGQRCNGVVECADGTDERDCDNCGQGKYYCLKSGKCIAAKHRCDGSPQCPQGEDELLCKKSTQTDKCNECPQGNLPGDIKLRCSDFSADGSYTGPPTALNSLNSTSLSSNPRSEALVAASFPRVEFTPIQSNTFAPETTTTTPIISTTTPITTAVTDQSTVRPTKEIIPLIIIKHSSTNYKSSKMGAGRKLSISSPPGRNLIDSFANAMEEGTQGVGAHAYENAVSGVVTSERTQMTEPKAPRRNELQSLTAKNITSGMGSLKPVSYVEGQNGEFGEAKSETAGMVNVSPCSVIPPTSTTFTTTTTAATTIFTASTTKSILCSGQSVPPRNELAELTTAIPTPICSSTLPQRELGDENAEEPPPAESGIGGDREPIVDSEPSYAAANPSPSSKSAEQKSEEEIRILRRLTAKYGTSAKDLLKKIEKLLESDEIIQPSHRYAQNGSESFVPTPATNIIRRTIRVTGRPPAKRRWRPSISAEVQHLRPITTILPVKEGQHRGERQRKFRRQKSYATQKKGALERKKKPQINS